MCDFNYDSNHTFFRFYKGYDEFKESLLDSRYNKIKNFNKLLINFRNIKTKKKQKHNLRKRKL